MFTQQGRTHDAMRARRINCLIAGLAVLAGGSIYFLGRPDEIGFVHWIRSVVPERLASLSAVHHPVYGSQLPGWIVFSLPDGLWAFAYTLFMITIWFKGNTILRYFWYATIPMLTLGSEILQWPGIIPGTFCVTDLVLITLGLVTGILTAGLTLKQSNYESEHAIFNAG